MNRSQTLKLPSINSLVFYGANTNVYCGSTDRNLTVINLDLRFYWRQSTSIAIARKMRPPAYTFTLSEMKIKSYEITYPLVNSKRFCSSSRFARDPIQPWNIVSYSSSSEWSGNASLYGLRISAGSSGETRQICGMAICLASAMSRSLSMRSATGGPSN